MWILKPNRTCKILKTDVILTNIPELKPQHIVYKMNSYLQKGVLEFNTLNPDLITGDVPRYWTWTGVNLKEPARNMNLNFRPRLEFIQ